MNTASVMQLAAVTPVQRRQSVAVGGIWEKYSMWHQIDTKLIDIYNREQTSTASNGL